MDDLRRVRRRCRAIVKRLTLPQPFTLEAFRACVAEQRGRPLHLHELPPVAAGGPCGVWIATADADHVWVEAGTSALHRTHITLHEIGHMLAGHTLLDSAYATRLMPDLGADAVAKMLARTSYSTEQERIAETLATLIAQRAEAPAANAIDDELSALRAERGGTADAWG